MVKLLPGLLISYIFIAGCVKNDAKCSFTDSNSIAPAGEIQSLKDSLDSAGIVALQHPSGFFYKISGMGGGTGITNLCTTLTVTYKGSFFNGKFFDSTAIGTAATFQLAQVILAWQKGLPLISKGGDINLYIPPSLAYGANPIKDTQGNTIIAGNSYLIYSVHIVDIR